MSESRKLKITKASIYRVVYSKIKKLFSIGG